MRKHTNTIGAALAVAAVLATAGCSGGSHKAKTVVQPEATSTTSTSVVRATTSTTSTTRPQVQATSVPGVTCGVLRHDSGAYEPQHDARSQIVELGDAQAASVGWYNLATHTSTDAWFTALGPRGWLCRGYEYTSSGPAMNVFPESAASNFGTSENPFKDGYDYHGPVVRVAADTFAHGPGVQLGCEVFAHDPAVAHLVNDGSCVLPAGRQVTKIGSRAYSFRDTDGARGVAIRENVANVELARFAVLTCRPGNGLTAATCDTIVADYVARNQ